MSGLPFILTSTGRARLINPENTGTSGLTISHIGLSASDAGVVGGVLQGEIKRLNTFAGQVVADDTIHVTIRDDSADVYSLRAFALYFEDGTLMGWHAQPAVILEKSAQAMLLMSGDIQFQNLDVTTLIFGDSNWTNPVATTTEFGVLRLATNDAALSGVSQVDAVAPAGLLHVLNSRLGAGAPSAFVKGLLGMATAALFRAAIGLGSASLRNEGAGNGLDADLLDGQHGAYYRDWANLTGKPATYAPTAHGHAWAEISGAPATATRWPAFDEVTGKPAAYPPSAHTHAAADITAGIFDVARIPDLEPSKVTGLTAALAALAPKASPQFSGSVGIGVAAGVPLDVLVGSSRLRFSEDASVATISATNAAASALSVLKLNATAVTRQGNLIWDEGNFDPATKASLSGANFTGTVTRVLGAMGNDTNYQAFQAYSDNAAGTAQIRYRRGQGSAYGGWDFYCANGASANVLALRLTPTGNAEFQQGVSFNVNLVSSTASAVLTTTGAGTVYLRPNGAGSAVGQMQLGQTGNLTVNGSVNASGGFQNTSSRRVKDITGPNPYGLREVLELETVVGSYKAEFSGDTSRRVFLVAENVAEVIPDGPARDMDGITFEGAPVLGLDHGQLLPVLVKAIQDLHAQLREQAAAHAADMAELRRLLDAKESGSGGGNP